MSGNNIRALESFPQGLKSLRVLDLQNNNLDFSALPGDVFAALSGLEVLNISLNQMWLTSPLHNLSRHYRGEIFSPLSSLRTLVMDSLPYGIPFPMDFASLTSLEHLKLRANMTNVRNETFAVFSPIDIKTLTIWSGFLVHLDALSFAHFSALAALDLSYNPILRFDEVSTAWYGLQFTNISELYLMYMTQFAATVVSLEQSFFVGLEKTNITKVALDGNNIVTIAGGFHCYLPKLQYLSVSRNRLLQIQDLMDDLGRLTDVRHIDVSLQSHRTYIKREYLINLEYDRDISKDTSGREQELLQFREQYHSQNEDRRQSSVWTEDMFPLNHSLIESFETPGFDGKSAGTNVPLKECVLQPVPRDMTKPLKIVASPVLEHLDLSGSISIDMEGFGTIAAILYNTTNLRYLDYSRNGLKVLNYPLHFVYASKHLITLDLSYNNISIGGFTNRPGNIEGLNLRGNRLGPQVSSYTSFSYFKNLKYLDLSDNKIIYLSVDDFKENKCLEMLNLAHNDLDYIPEGFFKMLHNLRFVDLSFNVITRLEPATIQELGPGTIGSNIQGETVVVNLTIACTCGNRGFLKWMEKQRSSAGWSHLQVNIIPVHVYQTALGTTCWINSPSGNGVILRNLNVECTWHLALVVSLPCAFVFMVVLCAVYCTRHKWDIKFWFLNNAMKRRKMKEDEAERNFHFEHDAFVAYHVDDVTWVKDTLLPEIEENGGMKLCVHHRDFMPGAAIEENILQSIQNSRKTILLLTRHFLQSNWCHFETQMARLQSIEGGRDIIIPVLLEDFDTLMKEEVSIILRKLLMKKTYLIWPDKEGERPQFWQRLRQALETTRATVFQCECGKGLVELPV